MRAQIEVTNGKAESQAAALMCDHLRKKNYRVIQVKPTQPAHFSETLVLYLDGYLHDAYRVAQEIPGYQNMKQVDRLRKLQSKIAIEIGKDLIPITASLQGQRVSREGTLILLLMAAMVLFPLFQALAQGTYRIEKDETGYYFQTDGHGGWVFNPKELGRPFKVGAVGSYTIESDDGGTYLVTDRYGRFLIDIAALNRLEKSREEYNRAVESARGRGEVSVVIVGNQVFVPAYLGYGGRETEALLLLDTGASVTVLHEEVADRIPFAKSAEGEITVVGGSKVRAKQVKLDYIRVGSIRKDGIHAAVIEHSGPSMQHQGLLGIDFLRDLQFRIDFEKQVLKWEG